MTNIHGKIEFEINYKKALEAILYVSSKREKVNVYNLLKAIFEADKWHLNQHGRPVTGDIYMRMQYGTVPSAIYDMLKQEPLPLVFLNLDAYPFEKDSHYIKAKRESDLSLLSESDVEALEVGLAKYIDLPFEQVLATNHSEQCWLYTEQNCQIDFEKIIENEEVRKMLLETPLKLVL